MRYWRKPLLVLALLGTLAVPALAQQPTLSQYPAACDASKVTKANVERAHAVFLSGKGFLDVSDYDKAISYFKDAYSIDCSVHAILPIIATAYERKGDKREAVHALEEYLKRAPGASDTDVVQQRIANLKDQIGREQPTVTAPATTTTPTTTTTTTNAGTSTTSTSTGTTTAVPTDSSTGGPPPGGHTIGPWILVGVGAAAVIGGIVLFVVGNNTVNNANADAAKAMCTFNPDKCPTPALADKLTNERNPGYQNETIGGVIGGIGIAAVAGGIIWHFAEGPSAPKAPGAATVAPAVAPGFAGLTIHGSF
jgi:tetratricopeptide (TPR) repeat protein